MNVLIVTLILFFLFMAYSSSFKEGLETQYKDYDLTNPANVMILAQQNAGNIAYLKQRIDDISGNTKISDLQNQVKLLASQVDALVQQQAQLVTPANSGVIESDQ